MTDPKRPPAAVVVGLILAVVLDTAVQICWKAAVPTDQSVSATLMSVAGRPLFQLAMVLFVCQFVNWILVLGKADVSFALPFTSLSYVTVAILSAIKLHEHIPTVRIGGIGLILLGVWLISRTPHRTVNTAESAR